MKQDKNKKSLSVQVKIFFSIFAVSMIIIGVLWGCQVLFINSIYRQTKTAELKSETDDIIRSLGQDDGGEVIKDLIVNRDDISIRIINITDFENLFSGGNGVVSASRDISDFEILKLYELAKENGGEISRYYTYDKNSERFLDDSFTVKITGSTFSEGGEKDESASRKEIGIHFFDRNPPAFFHIGSERYVNDYLYAKLAYLDDGTEIMVISDVRVTPLDSTVKILKHQLKFSTVIALIFSLIISYFVAKKISKPIVKINKAALNLAHGNFETSFTSKGYREIEELGETLNFASSELAKVDRYRTELLANVSHDLRTPLTMIEGYAEMMRDIPGENTPENAGIIIDETRRLTDLVNNILDLSKYRSGISEVKAETVNITELLEDIKKRYSELLKNDGYTVILNSDTEAFVNCDISKMNQAFYNLLDNAVTHTGEDKTVVINQIIRDGKVRIEICDSGEGIPEDKLPYIWDRYYKVDKRHKRAKTGSGIGLSIVKSIFESHMLVYGVETKEAGGSVFWVEFERILAK